MNLRGEDIEMKKVWNSFVVAFAMYSKIPMPRADWTKENMKYALCFFPWVGLAVGAMEYGWFQLAVYLGIGSMFRAAGMTVIPILVTGGIHMDGFLDTMDALSSWKEKEQRLAILKDPHAGAFAVIMGCTYFVVYLGAASEVSEAVLPVFCLSFGISRCLSALSLIWFRNANPKGSAAAFADRAQKRVVAIVLAATILLLCGGMCFLRPIPGIICSGTAVLVFFFYRFKSSKNFGGITGDLAGYFLSLCEIWMLVMAVFIQCGMERFL